MAFFAPIAAAEARQAATDANPVTTHNVSVTLKKGDTLLGLLRAQGLDSRYCAALLKAVGTDLTPRMLHIGDRLTMTLNTTASVTTVGALELQPKRGTLVEVSVPHGLSAVEIVRREIVGKVGSNLSAALQADGVPAPLATAVLVAGKSDPDLAPHLKPESTFDIVYSQAMLGEREQGTPSIDEIVFTTGSLQHRLYLYRDSFNSDALVNARGKGFVWLHLRQPVLNARLSSPFGWRIHPVFGDRRFHDGIDLAIAEGTPVQAAADGVVIDSGWHGNYGKYVRVRHSGGVETTYGHLSAIPAGIVAGARVAAGETIGAVGETGVATGPHLYFEVNVGGSYVDPLKPLKQALAVPINLTKAELTELKNQRLARN